MVYFYSGVDSRLFLAHGPLVLGDCLLALLVGSDLARGEIPLDGGEGHQFVEYFERGLAGKAVEQANEAQLVGKPQAVPGAFADFDEVRQREHRLPLELSLRTFPALHWPSREPRRAGLLHPFGKLACSSALTEHGDPIRLEATKGLDRTVLPLNYHIIHSSCPSESKVDP